MIRHAASLVALRRALAFLTLVILSTLFVVTRAAAVAPSRVPSVPSWVDRVSEPREVPDPPPAWHELLPKTTERRLTLIGEVAGHFWRWRGEAVYVWDLAAVRHPDGSVAILRASFQYLDGSLTAVRTGLGDHPPGSIEIHSLDEFLPNAGPALWWSDMTGEVFAMSMGEAGPGVVGPGGVVRIDPMERCLLHAVGRCLPDASCVSGVCTDVGRGCGCLDDDGTCTLNVRADCAGACSPGSVCTEELILGGCSCQR